MTSRYCSVTLSPEERESNIREQGRVTQDKTEAQRQSGGEKSG